MLLLRPSRGAARRWVHAVVGLLTQVLLPKGPPTEPSNKKWKKRDQRKSESSEGDEHVEEDPDEEEADDVLDIESPPIENLDRENELLGDLPNALPGIDIATELWDHIADHTGGTERNPQHLFVLVDFKQLQIEIGDA
ncbi:hypothetical protein L7F22_052301 [Adiantum nelumboides]|nr:hypothetical protein [Adiantum nelumboides]